MPTIYRYKGYTVEQVGLSHHIWRDFVTLAVVSRSPQTETLWAAWACKPRGPHGYAQSKAAALRWINSDRGLMTPVESGWIEAIGYAPMTAEGRNAIETTSALALEGAGPRVRALVSPLLRTLRRPGTGFVLVRFKTGKTTAYLCPSWTYGAVMRSKSKGKAFHRLIKSHPEVPVPAGLIITE